MQKIFIIDANRRVTSIKTSTSLSSYEKLKMHSNTKIKTPRLLNLFLVITKNPYINEYNLVTAVVVPKLNIKNKNIKCLNVESFATIS
jgi:hypothetical protein